MLLIAGLVVVAFVGLPATSYRTASLDRNVDAKVATDINAVHGMDRVSEVSDNQETRLVNVSNNFGSGSSPTLTYTVTILTHQSDVGIGGSVENNETTFDLAPGDGEQQININSSDLDSNITVKYGVNATGTGLEVNTTRTVTVTNTTS